MILFHDCETFCETPINHGTYRYAEGVEVMVHSWAIGVDGEAKVWDATDGSAMPAELEDALAEAETIVGHKYGSFDRLVLRAAGIEIAPERIHDLMVQAVSHGLPGALEKLGIIFKLPLDQQKDKAGKQLIQLFCKPRPKNAKLRRATKATHPVEWARFLDYARQDIPPMQALYKKLPQKNYPCERERQLWLLDQRMNDRGFKVDIELAHAAIETVKVAKKIIDARTQEMTEDELRSTTQRDKMLEILLKSFGVDLPDMTKSTLERRLEDPDLPPPVKELIAQRLQTSTTSNAKYNSLLKSVSSDGRLRGTQQFSGAIRTKRWAGRIFQPQNLPRPDWWYDEAEQELAIPCIKAGSAHLIYDEPIKLVSNAIRGCIIADEDKKLVVSDLEQVEARVLPWLAGEQWKLDAFAEYDAGNGYDLYTNTAARILNKHPSEVTKDERQAYGKVVELACFAPHTQVLTDTGIKSITEVKSTDRLWDGEEWVTHQGLIPRGSQNTIRVDGVDLTMDHEILSENGWQPAKMVASSPSILQSCLELGSASLSLLPINAARREGSEQLSFSAPAAPRHMQSVLGICVGVRLRDAIAALNLQPRRRKRNGTNTQILSQMMDTVVAFAGACLRALTGAIIRKTKAIRITERAELKYGLPGDQTEAPSSHIWSRLRGGMIQCWSWIVEIMMGTMRRAICGSSIESATCSIDVKSAISKRNWTGFGPVFDIAHAGPRNRFTILSDSGALIVHNCGYGGATGAFAQFAALYGVNLPEFEVLAIIRSWRELHPALCDWDHGFWTQLDSAARQAIMNPGKTFEAGEHIRFERWKEWLRMELPSGGYLNYAAPAIQDYKMKTKDGIKIIPNALTFMGINSYTRRWERLYTYGGKLSADATQTTAREIMAHNLPAIEAKGYAPVLLCHDEVVTEPLDEERFSAEELSKLLSKQPDWAPGLPLNADGFESKRYRK